MSKEQAAKVIAKWMISMLDKIHAQKKLELAEKSKLDGVSQGGRDAEFSFCDPQDEAGKMNGHGIKNEIQTP